MTSVTIDVLARPYATSLQAAWTQHSLPSEAEFVSHYKKWLADHDRVESFFDPYTNEFLILHWDVVADPEPQTPNIITEPADACTYAEHHVEGATYEGPLLEPIAEGAGELTQTAGIKAEAELMVSASFGDIKKQLDAAAANYDEMWLTASPRVVFMSYFVELPNLDDEGLAKVWKGLQAIPERVASNDGFLPAGPLEFRFIKGGDSVLAGTWSTNPDATFVNLDLIGFVAEEAASDYPLELLAFFADIERAWVALGGVTHNGKMYGFYDPSKTDGYTAPFNPAFLSWLKAERGARVEAFEAYRKTVDPDGRFCNEYLGALIGCGNPTPAP